MHLFSVLLNTFLSYSKYDVFFPMGAKNLTVNNVVCNLVLEEKEAESLKIKTNLFFKYGKEK